MITLLRQTKILWNVYTNWNLIKWFTFVDHNNTFWLKIKTLMAALRNLLKCGCCFEVTELVSI